LACPASTVLIHGCVWTNVTASAQNATIIPAGNPDAQFNTAAINYNSSVGGFTFAGFLNNPVFTDTSAGWNPNAQLGDSFYMFTGQMFLNAGNNSFVLGHDDSAVLNVTGIGTVLSVPGPTAFVNSPFNVVAPSAGLYSFTLQYGECCGAPAALLFTVNGAPIGNSAVPEPATFVLLGTGLAVAIARARQIRKS